jgi:hypothetical protein
MELDTSKAILVWAWDDAPKELQALSTHGGDEDGIALLPPGMATNLDNVPWWLERMWDTSASATHYQTSDGAPVIIWAHA